MKRSDDKFSFSLCRIKFTAQGWPATFMAYVVGALLITAFIALIFAPKTTVSAIAAALIK